MTDFVKLFYLASKNMSPKWAMPIRNRKAALDFLRKAQSCYAALSALYDMTQRLWPVVAAAEVTEEPDLDAGPDLVTVLDRSLSTLKCAIRLIDAMQTSAAGNPA